MDIKLKNKVVRIQKRFLGAIRSHQVCYNKILNGDSSETLQHELEDIRRQILRCHEEQSILLHEINSLNLGEAAKFDFYDLSDVAGSKKSRRRKDVMPSANTQPSVPRVSVYERRSLPEEVTSSSGGEESDGLAESEEDIEAEQPLPLSLPIPVISNRPSRYKVKPKIHRGIKLTREQKEELNRTLPVYPPTIPTPPPEDEDEAKIRHMAAVKLIPQAALAEMLNRKTERKRRSAATNNTYIFRDRESSSKRKQYLAPKLAKQSRQSIPKGSDEGNNSPSSSQPDSLGDNLEMCKECSLYVNLQNCFDCHEEFHVNCKTRTEVDNEWMCAACNLRQKSALSVTSGENIQTASGTLYQDYSAIEARDKYRLKLVNGLRSRIVEKAQLEKKVVALSVSLALQDRVKNDLLQEHHEVNQKIRSMESFVKLYQKQKDKPDEDVGGTLSPAFRVPQECQTPSTSSEDLTTPDTFQVPHSSSDVDTNRKSVEHSPLE